MEEKKTKKKKLTLSVSSKQSHKITHYAPARHKTSVVIEKKISRRGNDRNFYNRETYYLSSSG